MTEIVEGYHERYESLCGVAAGLEVFLEGQLAGLEHIDRISVRAKAPASFARKAEETQDGERRYSAPLSEIQDQIGARVVVYYLDDVEAVAAELEALLTPIERKDLVPDSEAEFGYFGRHWVFALPADVIPAGTDTTLVPRFFELQVKTLFQHAWAEANHDLGYKPTVNVTSEQHRLFAFAAAQAWGADRVFEELRAALSARP